MFSSVLTDTDMSCFFFSGRVSLLSAPERGLYVRGTEVEKTLQRFQRVSKSVLFILMSDSLCGADESAHVCPTDLLVFP